MSATSRSSWLITLALAISAGRAAAQAPSLVEPNLAIRTVATGLSLPTSMAFLGANDLFVLEKNSGRVLRFGELTKTEVLNLAVNFASERGLLGIALHPHSRRIPGCFSIGRRARRGQTPVFAESRCSAIASIASSGTVRR